MNMMKCAFDKANSKRPVLKQEMENGGTGTGNEDSLNGDSLKWGISKMGNL